MPGPNGAARLSRGEPNKWIVAVTVMFGSFIAVMDISVVNVALPHMMGAFSESQSAITWVATSYSIAEIILATMAGWWSTLLGRKRLYLMSYLVFTSGSVLAGTATTLSQMIVYRVIQGTGGGALIPVSQAILRERFPKEEQGMAMAIYGMGVVLAPGIGVVLGGWLTDRFGWPWIFYINVPVALVGILMVSVFLYDPPYLVRGVQKIDWGGIGLLAAALTGMQIVLERGEQENWFDSNLIIAGTLITAVAAVALILWELYVAEHPVVDFRVLKNLPLTVGSTIGIIFGVGLLGTAFIIPQFTENLLGYPAFEAGLVMLPRVIALFIFMPVAGWLYKYLDPRLLVLLGLAVLFVGFHELSHLSLQMGFWSLVPALVFMGVGAPFMFVTLSTVSLSTIPKPDMTKATSLFTLARRIGGNIGYALAATLVARRLQFHHARMSEAINPYNPAYRAFHQRATEALTAHGMSAQAAGHTATGMVGQMVNRQSTMMAYNDTAWILGMMFLAVVPLVFLIPSRKRLLEEAS